MEEDRKLYEVLDLGFGKCRMCVCGPESARDLLKNHGMIRVASKYPKIAKDYFNNKKGQTVENGLGVLEEVCPLSARMVVNQVSMKMEDERIRKIISDLKEKIK